MINSIEEYPNGVEDSLAMGFRTHISRVAQMAEGGARGETRLASLGR